MIEDIIPKRVSCVSCTRYQYPQIQITIHSKDIIYMSAVFENFSGYPYKVKGKKAYRIDLTSEKDINQLVSIMNGRLKTDMYFKFEELVC